ncbi:MAG TPA: BatA domain-containing protein [Thermoanaerobaculia bacterium]
MVPFLTTPFALLALLGIPVLIAIYFFQRRYRTRDVSSLILWATIRPPSASGRTRDRVRLPLTFWLELLLIVLLSLAAAGPLVASWLKRRPLVVVLDDSLSMQVGARERGRAFLDEELARRGYSPVRFIFAGETPQLAGETKLDAWTCHAPAADLEAGMGLAVQIGGPAALVLVITDHAPEREPPSNVRWLAFGDARPNAGLSAAARSTREQDSALFEVASYSSRPLATTLTITTAGRVLQRTNVSLAPAARQRVRLTLPPGIGPIEARLGDDAAPYDNVATLLSEKPAPVRVAVDLAEGPLHDAVLSALAATGRARVVEGGADVRITEGAAANGQPPGSIADTYVLSIDTTRTASAFVGPYVIDRAHPLAGGFALEGIAWGAGRPLTAGQPIVTVGGRALLTDESSSDGGHRIRMSFDPTASTLHRSPAWPALFWNLLEWRASELPGLRGVNLPIGAIATFVAPRNVTQLSVTPPQSRAQTVLVDERRASIAATRPGIWTVVAGDTRHQFAVNAIATGESDLSRAKRGEWGRWSEASLRAGGYENIAWLFLLIALAILLWHQKLVAVPA